ncbi:MAG: M48 family metallopeptidase [Victivallaceae bacterium]|nr:M48 family metallopeptidase [Victivallaceae bacterium]
MKKLLKRFILLATAVNIAFLCGCSSVPYTERSRLLLTSEQTENELGRQAWEKMLAEAQISTDKKHNAALLRVGKNIAAVSGKPEYRWEFRVFVSRQANAFCLPGGKVGATSSLFDFTANDAELATVVGHEISHALARHGGERMSHGLLQTIGSEAVSYATEEPMFVTAFGLVSNVAAILPYSRVHEYEADYIGLILMAKAGYYPRAAVSFWEKFGKNDNDQRLFELLSTHPMSKKRLDEMKTLIPKAREYYDQASPKRGFGEKL